MGKDMVRRLEKLALWSKRPSYKSRGQASEPTRIEYKGVRASLDPSASPRTHGGRTEPTPESCSLSTHIHVSRLTHTLHTHTHMNTYMHIQIMRIIVIIITIVLIITTHFKERPEVPGAASGDL